MLEGDRVTAMARLLLIPLLLFTVTPTVRAEDGARLQDSSLTAEIARHFDLQSGLATLNRLLSTADQYLQEHFEVDGEFRADSSSDGGAGRFHFKWYPEGKSRSSEGFETDARYETLPHQFSFRFRLSEPRPQDESPEGNIL
jgi:hypothetical protein